MEYSLRTKTMELVGKIFICGIAIYLGRYSIAHWPMFTYEIGIGVGGACALSLSY